jgi:sarcosine oxidase delta subunit
METNFLVQCPYCGEQIWMEFYPEDGVEQEMITDCEVCCNPILYQVVFRGESARVKVERAQ